ncbi:MAG: hypothetical protein ACYC6S_06065 [Desulfobulbia bacterium]
MPPVNPMARLPSSLNTESRRHREFQPIVSSETAFAHSPLVFTPSCRK